MKGWKRDFIGAFISHADSVRQLSEISNTPSSKTSDGEARTHQSDAAHNSAALQIRWSLTSRLWDADTFGAWVLFHSMFRFNTFLYDKNNNKKNFKKAPWSFFENVWGWFFGCKTFFLFSSTIFPYTLPVDAIIKLRFESQHVTKMKKMLRILISWVQSIQVFCFPKLQR